MAFDDGSFYFPIGLNLGWASRPNLGVLSDYARWLTVPGATVHIYGKGAPRPGRKMGHVTQVAGLPEAG
jgi:phosphoribosylaminoimidazole carboxylase (NCAIR synthetase)